MANEIILAHEDAGITNAYFVVIKDIVGTVAVYNHDTAVWETWNEASIAEYAYELVEQMPKMYIGNFPTVLTAAQYYISAFYGPKTNNDSETFIGSGSLVWDGSNEVPGKGIDVNGHVTLTADGLDNISADEPIGVAETFREKLVQVWSRFFNKVRKDKISSNIIVYQDDGETAMTTQAFSEITSRDDVGKAQ